MNPDWFKPENTQFSHPHVIQDVLLSSVKKKLRFFLMKKFQHFSPNRLKPFEQFALKLSFGP